jgi:RNA polymerase subunit RPABC4/transcription elongation factor Spt4
MRKCYYRVGEGDNFIEKEEWLLCPVCGNKTRTKLRQDTILINFPLYCPKCKQETFVNVRQFNISVIIEPDAKAQSR